MRTPGSALGLVLAIITLLAVSCAKGDGDIGGDVGGDMGRVAAPTDLTTTPFSPVEVYDGVLPPLALDTIRNATHHDEAERRPGMLVRRSTQRIGCCWKNRTAKTRSLVDQAIHHIAVRCCAAVSRRREGGKGWAERGEGVPCSDMME